MDGYAVRAADTAQRAGQARSVIGSPQPAAATTAPSGQARRCASSPARRCPPAPTPSSSRRTPKPATTAPSIAKEPVAAGRHIRRAGLDFQERRPAARRRAPARHARTGARRGRGQRPALRAPPPARRDHRHRRRAGAARRDALAGPDLRRHLARPGGLCRILGGKAENFGIVRDDRAAITRAVEAGARRCPPTWCSPSAAPRSATTISSRTRSRKPGSSLDFWRVAMRPGKPLMYRPHRGHAGPRPPRQPGVEPRLRHPLPAAADRRAARPAAARPDRVRHARRATCRRTTTARITSAPASPRAAANCLRRCRCPCRIPPCWRCSPPPTA